MLIRNARKTIIAKNARLCRTSLSKFLGLMFSKKQENALIFEFKREKNIALHMVFVFYPIDVLFLDKNKIVVDKKENFRPFSFYSSREKAMYAIELPHGTFRQARTDLGDKIIF